uniref:Uncharacterized protein n=1 Tax=Callithrix jacchus TaxID=9483 RepID=A0A2R8NF23_CALJA
RPLIFGKGTYLEVEQHK